MSKFIFRKKSYFIFLAFFLFASCILFQKDTFAWITIETDPPYAAVPADGESQVEITVTVIDPGMDYFPVVPPFPRAGDAIAFQIISGHGSISPFVATTDAAGQAYATFTAPDLDKGEEVIIGVFDITVSQSESFSVAAFTVEIKQDGNYITNTTHDEIIGKRINLIGEVIPTGVPIDSKKWTIPGERIKDYSATTTSTTLTQLTPSDLENSSVNYCWFDGGIHMVEYMVAIGKKKFYGEATFDVKVPTSTMTSSTGIIAVSNVWGPSLDLHYGTPSTAGISFLRTINIPSGFFGVTKYWQRVNSTRSRLQREDGGWRVMKGKNLCDAHLPFPSDYGITNDSPGLTLFGNYKQATAKDDFTMWLMFKPSGDGSIWVPLRKTNWSWYGSAVRDHKTGTWNLKKSKNNVNPPSSVTTEFPEWTGNVRELSF